MDIVSDLHGLTYYSDTAVVTPFSFNGGLISAASARLGYMAKREEKKKFERYPRINLYPFVLETTGRPGYHAQKFIKYLYSDMDHPPTAIRDPFCLLLTSDSPQTSHPFQQSISHFVVQLRAASAWRIIVSCHSRHSRGRRAADAHRTQRSSVRLCCPVTHK